MWRELTVDQGPRHDLSSAEGSEVERQGLSNAYEIEKSSSSEAARFGTGDNDFIVDAFRRQLGGIAD